MHRPTDVTAADNYRFPAARFGFPCPNQAKRNTSTTCRHGRRDERIDMKAMPFGRRYSMGIRGAVVAAAAISALAACGSSSSTTAPASTSASPTSSASGTGTGTATGTPIKIGEIGEYSGFSSETSKPSEIDLQAWASSVNANGGINGHPVQIIVEDDAGVAAKSVVAVKKLIQDDHVIALVGNHETGLESSWAKYADSEHIPVVGGDATGITYSTDPNFFPIGNTGVNGSVSYFYAAKLFGKTKVSTVYCAETPSCAQIVGLQTYWAKALGLVSAPAEGISATAANYTAQCTKLKQTGADSVFTATARVTAEGFIQTCRTQGYSPLFVDSPQNWQASATTNPAWQGAVLAADAPLWFGNGPGTADYVAAVNKYAPGSIENTAGTNGWYSGKLFQTALETAAKNGDTGPVTSQTVYDGLYALGPKFDLGGIVAPVTYAKGKPAVQELCQWYAQVVNKTLTTPKGAGRICEPTLTPPAL
jgi:branched-chain amino acid transport system substrate-binding protein